MTYDRLELSLSKSTFITPTTSLWSPLKQCKTTWENIHIKTYTVSSNPQYHPYWIQHTFIPGFLDFNIQMFILDKKEAIPYIESGTCPNFQPFEKNTPFSYNLDWEFVFVFRLGI